MNAIYQKELKSYFTGITGYIFTAIMLVAAGIYTMIYQLSYQYAVFEYVYASVTFIYLIAIPILAMRSYPEERKQKTEQLLYSLPLKMSDIVLGKYLAAVTVLAIPTAIMTVYPFVLSFYGTFNFKIILSTMLCFFLLGCVLLAACMFISTLTENQILAALFSFIIVFIVYFASNIEQYSSSSTLISVVLLIIGIILVTLTVMLLTSNKALGEMVFTVLAVALVAILIFKSSLIEGVASAVLEKIAIFENMYNVIYGSFDLTYVIYLLTIVFLFNFFSIQVLEKRRWA